MSICLGQQIRLGKENRTELYRKEISTAGTWDIKSRY